MAKEQTGSNPDSATAEDAVFGPSGENFFGALEDSVNSAIQDDMITEETPPETVGPEKVTQNVPPQDPKRDSNWELRYKDSSREAVRLKQELDQLKPFVPVLDAMKGDAGLIEHVRTYLREGGAPAKTVQESLGLDEDFEFNPHELDNPGSDSSKVLAAQVDRLVQGRVHQALSSVQKNAQAQSAKMSKMAQAKQFMQKHNMSPEQFQQMMGAAQKRQLTLDDVHLLLNKDTAKRNVASNTKSDMLKQMKNVRNIPQSASGTNSAPDDKGYEDAVFDMLNESDGNVDKMFE